VRGVQGSARALSQHRRRQARDDGVCRVQAGSPHLVRDAAESKLSFVRYDDPRAESSIDQAAPLSGPSLGT
jgi:hypothetical protein